MRNRWVTRNLNQVAVYWGNPTNDGFGGFTFDDPVEIAVRWTEANELFIDSTGAQVVSSAIVYHGTDLSNEGFLVLGTLAGLSPEEKANPLLANASQIRGINKVPDRTAQLFIRKVFL